MSNTTNLARTEATHDELFELIPWYVNGTLDPTEHDIVERHLEGCNDCANEVQWLTGVYDVANTSAEVYPLPGQGFDKLRARIERGQYLDVEDIESTSLPARDSDAPGALSQWLSSLISALRQRPASWAAVPAALVVAILVYSNVETFGPTQLPQGNMTTLTSEGATEHLTTLTVQPVSEAARRSILSALESTGAQGELRLGNDGDFRVLLASDTDLAAVKRLLNTMRSAPSIETAALLAE